MAPRGHGQSVPFQWEVQHKGVEKPREGRRNLGHVATGSL